MGITVTGAKEVREVVSALEKRAQNLSPIIPRIGAYQVSAIQKRIRDGLSPANSKLTQAYKQNNKPLRDTGQYLASFTWQKTGLSSLKVGTPKRQAKILSEGGVIRPKKARMLYIPAGAFTRQLERKSNASTSSESSVRAVIEWLENNNYQVWWAKNVVMCKKGKKGKETPIYFLKKQVTIPARPHIFVSREDEIEIQGFIRRYVLEDK